VTLVRTKWPYLVNEKACYVTYCVFAKPRNVFARARTRLGSVPDAADWDYLEGQRPRLGLTFDPVITLLAERGWTRELIDETYARPARAVATRDTRLLRNGARRDDPATAYYSWHGGYFVRNDLTGEVVEVSDRNDPGWRAPWDD
jgi:hypothetical protein